MCVSKEKWRNKYVGYLSVLLQGCGLYLNRVPVWHSHLSLSLSQTPLFGRIKPSFSFGGLCHLFSAFLHMWSWTCTQINTHRKEFPFKIQYAYFWWTSMELHQQWACNHSPSPFTHSLTQSGRLGDHLSKDLTHFMLFVKSTLELFIERYQHLSLPTRS